LLVSQAERRQVSRRERLQQHVGGQDETSQQVAAVFGLEVERDATLARVVVPEVEATLGVRRILVERPNIPLSCSLRRLDLDDIGAEVRHQLAAPLALLVGELQHAQVSQRPRCVPRPSRTTVHDHRYRVRAHRHWCRPGPVEQVRLHRQALWPEHALFEPSTQLVFGQAE
jgi:hypothetical protein